MQALAITSVKNEGAFLLEWIAHHRAVGFDHFLVHSNDCGDGSDLMLDRLERLGILTHVPNPGPHPKGPQWAALKAAEGHPRFAAADWIAVIDVDEFVNIHVGARRLPDLLSALPEASAIPMTWRLFGNGGAVEFRDEPVTRSFFAAAPAMLGWPWRAQMFKTLFRNDGSFARLGVHRPRAPDPARRPRWFDGSGREVTDELGQGARPFSDFRRDNYGLVQLNHYPLGSMESYLVKADRGRANREAGPFDLGYWIERNLCEVEDRTILGLDLGPELARLMADPELARLHAGAVAWRRRRLVELLADEDWRALFGRLLMAGQSRSLDPQTAGLVTRHRPRREGGNNGA